ncbi:MAG: MFS transporter [Thermomicrobiales bacterium]|nr:MFS transporter [Thermomicrobiales bacterium]
MSKSSTQSRIMLFIVFCAFISIGFPDAVLGVAWPEMRIDFGRTRADLAVILIFNTFGYFSSGALAGTILEKLGVGKTLAYSTLLVATGLFGYAISPSFWLLPLVAICVGFGSGAVDAGLNFYAAEHYSNMVMNWLHAFFGFGAMIGPFIMAATLNAGASWRWGYATVAMVTLVLAIIFVLRMNSWDETSHASEEGTTRMPARQVLSMPSGPFRCRTRPPVTPRPPPSRGAVDIISLPGKPSCSGSRTGSPHDPGDARRHRSAGSSSAVTTLIARSAHPEHRGAIQNRCIAPLWLPAMPRCSRI